jgi:hypothetical protein
MVMRKNWLGLALASATGCGVPAPPPSTGGVDIPANGDCPGALAVVNSDYLSSNISVLSVAGDILSESIISSGSAPPGLSAALSGDVALPTTAPASGRLVLLDRYPNAVITWVEPESAGVLAQLSVATGFTSNPQDYLELSSTKAYVSRLQTNPNPGAEPNDGGGDILIVDPSAFAITGSVPLASPDDGAFFPSPSELLPIESTVWVMLERFDSGFHAARDARIVGISAESDAIEWSLDLPGVANCGAMALDPAAERVAIACSGVFADAVPAARSGIVILDATETPPVELARFDIASAVGTPPQPSLAWASDGTLLGATYGDLVHGVSDVAYALDVTSGATDVLFEAGSAFVLGQTACSPGCTDTCFVADANAKLLRSWQANLDSLARGRDVVADPRVGLPPRGLGFLIGH